jgi:hypothetical protein
VRSTRARDEAIQARRGISPACHPWIASAKRPRNDKDWWFNAAKRRLAMTGDAD